MINDAQVTPMQWLDAKQLERIAIRALGSNGTVIRSSLRTVEWDISGKCRAPVLVELAGRPTTKAGGGVFPAEGKPIHIDLLTKCRKCDPCLHARRILWQDRGRYEYAASTRTWLVTLTNRPDVHARQLALARTKLAKQGLDFDLLPHGEQFSLRAAEMGKELTLFIKRLRKNSKAPFRYLAVTEMHKNGAPHLHVLLHEQDIGRPLTKRAIQGLWPHGFSNCKLVEDVRQAVYVCKYLSKTKVARVRASLRYGSETRVERSRTIVSPEGGKLDTLGCTLLANDSERSVTQVQPQEVYHHGIHECAGSSPANPYFQVRAGAGRSHRPDPPETPSAPGSLTGPKAAGAKSAL